MAETMVSTTTARSPLAETTNRINATYPGPAGQSSKSRYDQSLTSNPYDPPRAYFRGPPTQHATRAPPATRPVAPNRQPATALRPPQEIDEQKRLSQASHDSSTSSRSKKNYKTHIGPWQLGKTLGKGSSARVRLCRHNITHQLAAVKIVNRRMAYLVHDSSLAALTKWDNSLPEQINGEMRVPMAIEREVAILKLIEHPNIMKLYDIWENRSEIYLILEYIDQGDLFTFINMKGRLSEEVSIYFFRQIMSAITYCHSFNICHRDLKPENILITADLQIKIADFGMAALHQTDTHQLATACGSPHYAAPELLKNRQYRGDRADIWSMGVILYAMLSATLPFDDPDLRVMMAKTKKGQYQMPDFLTPEAEDLIRRMLQVNPDRRITLKEIWRHPLIQKYAYLDNLGETNGQPPDTRKGFQYNPVLKQDIDPQLLRQLRSMWHMFSENDLKMKLSCDESNDQKAFYWLLYNYREKQLEDFKPEIAHSMSDYHHLKPGVWKKRFSTCEFASTRGNGHGRSISRFTVISNAAETESGTVQSYDPYRGSRILKTSNSQVSQAKITVHRDGNYAAQTTRLRSGSSTRRRRMSAVRNSTGRLQSSRGSLSSLHSSRQGTPHARGPSLRHKRGVDFTHARKRSSSVSRHVKCPPPSYVTENGSTYQLQPTRSPTPEMSSLPSGVLPKQSRKQSTAESRDESEIFNEELRYFSSNIAKDCDEAFKSSLIEEESIAGSLTDVDRALRDSTPFSFSIESPEAESTPEKNFPSKSVNSRPLPPLPSMSELHDPSLIPTPLASRPTSQDDTGELPTDQVKLALPILLPRHSDRRIASAPAYTHGHRKPVALPSINETGGPSDKSRIVSAPPHTPKKANEKDRSMDYLSKVENSIRIVNSPSAPSPVKAPEPLNVRKKVSTDETGRKLHQKVNSTTEVFERVAQDTSVHDRQGSMKKKKSSWFKRSSKVESEGGGDFAEWHEYNSSMRAFSDAKRTDSSSTGVAAKKKSFSFPFWKSHKARDSGMSISRGPEDKDTPSAEIQAMKAASNGRTSQMKWHESGSGGGRNIEVKQNWLARLFRVKPAMSHLCMSISRRQARQEIALLLREWRKYGIRGIQVDKQRNIVFARVGAKNFLNLKEVSFAAEVMTVIEHGKKQPLSIIRFTQERGAASSFHRVVDTMKVVFDCRGLLVADRNKQKMMIKTLNA
ncbi:Fc.00g040870.m01.CDS01 [Cosmosporella sp. VM-42]